jgi:hypothetical protein
LHSKLIRRDRSPTSSHFVRRYLPFLPLSVIVNLWSSFRHPLVER